METPDADAVLRTLHEVMADFWEREVLSDSTEPDCELIAAFIDGGLDAQREAVLARHIDASPRAFEILVSLLPDGKSLPSADRVGTLGTGVELGASRPVEPVSALRQVGPPNVMPPGDNAQNASTAVFPPTQVLYASRAGKYFAAAAVFLAAGLSIVVIHQHQDLQVARADRDRVKQNLDMAASDLQTLQSQLQKQGNDILQVRSRLARAELVSPKLALARAVAPRRRVYIGGQLSLDLLESILDNNENRMSTNTPDDTELNIKEAAALQTLGSVLSEKWLPQSDRDLEQAVGQIWAGNLDKADGLLERLETVPIPPHVLNARGAWHATRADDPELNDTARSEEIQAAEKLFRQAGDQGDSTGWFNLIQLLQAEGRADAELSTAIERFLQSADQPTRDRLRPQLEHQPIRTPSP